ncbi:MAG TPA: mechanosensitive ion channel [Desulfurococcales archaeon]|nr:mechanosensitive ion channel [Desulfurococcales archaeon]
MITTQTVLALVYIALSVVVYIALRRILNYLRSKGRISKNALSILILLMKLLALALVSFLIYQTVILAFPGLASALVGLMATAGFAGIIIGLAAQSSLSHVISGIILVMSKTIRVGDLIEYEKNMALIEDISLTHTILRLRDGRRIAVPNSTILSIAITNYNLIDEKVATEVDVGISYESSIELAVKAMLEAANEHPLVLENPPPQVLITGFGESSIDLKLYAWIDDPWLKPIVESDLRHEILRKFREYGVEIPYPRRVIIYQNMQQIANSVDGDGDKDVCKVQSEVKHSDTVQK